MKRYCSLFAAALLLAACLPLRAQGVQLDSLWGKFVGDVNAMTFSPDSKQLLIAGADSWLRFFTADKGELLDSIAPQYGCRQLLYSHNGQLLFVAGVKGIHIFRAEDKSSVALIPLNLSEPSWFLSMDISPDDNFIAVKVMMPPPPDDVTLKDGYQRMMVFSYPEKQLLWQKDVPLWKASLKIALPKGKIAFSSDGNYILGHYNYNLARWDWRDSTKKEEILVSGLPDLDLIAFSPDRNYFVLQSNHIYSIREKKKIEISSIGNGSTNEYATNCTFTHSGTHVIVTKDYTLFLIDLRTHTAFIQPNITAVYNFTLSSDSLLLANSLGRGLMRMHRVNWLPRSVNELMEKQVDVHISTLHTNEKAEITISSGVFIPFCSINIIDMKGVKVQELYKGSLNIQNTTFLLDNRTLPSGSYFLHLRYGSSSLTHPFIITK